MNAISDTDKKDFSKNSRVLEDKLWALKAKATEPEGYLSSEETDAFLKFL
jgi:hypothetical protein